VATGSMPKPKNTVADVRPLREQLLSQDFQTLTKQNAPESRGGRSKSLRLAWAKLGRPYLKNKI
jgi:hypothetical protein